MVEEFKYSKSSTFNIQSKCSEVLASKLFIQPFKKYRERANANRISKSIGMETEHLSSKQSSKEINIYQFSHEISQYLRPSTILTTGKGARI